MMALPWLVGTYLRKDFSSLRFDPSVHDGAALLAEGFQSYDPSRVGDDACTDTHAWTTTVPCYHGYSWMCEQAPRALWNPLAAEPRFRDEDYFRSHRDEVEAYDKAHPSDGPAPDDDARLARYKALRASGVAWSEIFAREDAGVAKAT